VFVFGGVAFSLASFGQTRLTLFYLFLCDDDMPGFSLMEVEFYVYIYFGRAGHILVA
jgi:hypothetical protein